jgi:hypothetical protein
MRSSRFRNDHITVTHSEGSRGPDGYSESKTETVLDSSGDAQQLATEYVEQSAHFEIGDIRFFAAEPVTDVTPGDGATVDTKGGRTIKGTVEVVEHDDNSLLISLDS